MHFIHSKSFNSCSCKRQSFETRSLGENIRRRPGKLDWETTHPASGRSEVEFRSSNPIAIGPNIFLPTFETISGIINTFGDIHKDRVK